MTDLADDTERAYARMAAAFQPLRTQRLTMRPMAAGDAADVFEQAGDPEVAEMTGSLPHPLTREGADVYLRQFREDWLSGSKYYLAILETGTGAFVGGIMMLRDPADREAGEVGLWLGKKWWRYGYGYEAFCRVIAWAFEDLKLSRVIGRAFVENQPSLNGLLKTGFTPTEQREVDYPVRGGTKLCQFFVLEPENFRAPDSARDPSRP